MFERFTEKAIKAVMLSQEESRQLGHNFVGTEQILLGLVGETRGIASRVLGGFDVNLPEARKEVERLVGRGSGFVSVQIPFTPRAKRVLELSIEEARDLGHGYVGTEHMLLALLEEEAGIGMQILQQLGLRPSVIRTEVLAEIGANEERPQLLESDYDTPALDDFTVNLTQLAESNALDPVVGRDKEIDRVLQILARRRKNNPILVGEPGVGKTAIAEGLADRIVGGSVPEFIKGAQIVSLDVGLLLAGTRYRGEFEERLKCVLEDLVALSYGYPKANGDPCFALLVIDEIHTVVGSGAAEGAVDGSNILKPGLSRGLIHCLGATTVEEYRSQIERDAALERRFQPVQIGEPSVLETIGILRIIRANFEEHHGLRISEKALSAAATLSNNFIQDRFLPDKAIDLIDEASACVSIRSQQLPESVRGLEREIEQAARDKSRSIQREDFKKASRELEREMELRAQLSAVLAGLKESGFTAIDERRPIVQEEDVAVVVEAWTGIPVQQVSQSESATLLQMEEKLRTRIIGQRQAVNSVTTAVKRARVGLKNPNRPIASFLFSGPTGVGKTELVKALAECFYMSKDALVRLDMSEYMERHTVAKLIGSPPGYIGYSEGGQLTEAVRRKPYTIVLFDEVEKAHPSVFNLLLQVLEDGRLTDSKGRTTDFKNTIIVLTSNIGAQMLDTEDTPKDKLGFNVKAPDKIDPLMDQDTEDNDEEEPTEEETERYDGMKIIVNRELKKFFRPEFINRLDEIIVFDHLTKKNLEKIAVLLLNELSNRMKERFTLVVSDSARRALIESEYNKAMGARPLRRAFQKLLESRLASSLLDGSIKPNSTVEVTTNEDAKLIIKIKDKEIPVEKEPEDAVFKSLLPLMDAFDHIKINTLRNIASKGYENYKKDPV
jgi:ATP-dependent Clp protease ATP-binding subunit ClpC